MGQGVDRDGVQHGAEGDFQSGLGKPGNGLTQLTDHEEREVGNTTSDRQADISLFILTAASSHALPPNVSFSRPNLAPHTIQSQGLPSC